MPRSPTPLTVASFLLLRPPSNNRPPPPKRGNKRSLPTSPPTSKPPSDLENFPPLAKKVLPLSTFDSLHLPYATQEQTLNITSPLSSNSTMSSSIETDDGHLLDDVEGMEITIVSPDEAAALLGLDTEAAIDNHIREEEAKLAALRASLLEARSKKSLNKEPKNLLSTKPVPSTSSNIPNPTAPVLPSIAKNLPKLMEINTNPNSSGSASKNPSYAAKAAKNAGPVRPKEMVEDFLHIYASHTRKTPISRLVWEQVDEHLINIMADRAEHGESNPGKRVAHSGFDASHGCGFIACRDPVSAEWYKSRVAEITGPDGAKFRAWGKADVPISRLCRIFIPDRFKKIHDARIAPIIMGLNPPMENGTISHKDITPVQGGRAVFLEVDMDTYSYIRTKHYKLDWLMGSVDCHGVAPVSKSDNDSDTRPVNSEVPGVIKLTGNQAGPPVSSMASSTSNNSGKTETSTSQPVILDSDNARSSPIRSIARTQTNLAFSPLTPVKQARALEEEVLEDPASNNLDPRKRENRINPKNKSKQRKLDSSNDSKKNNKSN